MKYLFLLCVLFLGCSLTGMNPHIVEKKIDLIIFYNKGCGPCQPRPLTRQEIILNHGKEWMLPLIFTPEIIARLEKENESKSESN